MLPNYDYNQSRWTSSKICMYVFKCLQRSAPEYLTDFLSHKLKPATGPLTRSSADTSLPIAHVGKNRIGDISFYVFASSLWNSLPRNIREACTLSSFKKGLKVSFISISLTLFCNCLLYCIMFFMAFWSYLERRLLNVVMCVCMKTMSVDSMLGKNTFFPHWLCTLRSAPRTHISCCICLYILPG